MLTRHKTIGVAGIVAAVCLLLSAAGAQALGRSFWGVANTTALSHHDVVKMHRARVGVTRVDLYQQQIEPVPGSPDFSSSDQLIGRLASKGIKALPDLLVSQSNPPPPVGSSSARQQWQQFVRDVVKRYKPGGSYWSGPFQSQFPGASRKPVRFVQVGNEPNLKKYFPSNNPVKDYATLLKISHSAIRSAYPHAKVVLAGIPGFVAYRGWK